MSNEPIYIETKRIYAALINKIPALPVSLHELELTVADMLELVSREASKHINRGYDFFSVESSIPPAVDMPDGNKRYTMYSSFNSREQKHDLKRYAEDLAMAYYKCHGGKEFLKTQDLLDSLNKEQEVIIAERINVVELSKDAPFMCSIDGIRIDVPTLVKLADFYAASCTAEYVNENHPDLTGEQAMELGYETRRLMDKYGYDEEEAIEAAMNNLELGNKNNDKDEEPDV